MNEPRSRAHLKYLEWWHSAGCVGQEAAGNWIAEIEAERDALEAALDEIASRTDWTRDDCGKAAHDALGYALETEAEHKCAGCGWPLVKRVMPNGNSSSAWHCSNPQQPCCS